MQDAWNGSMAVLAFCLNWSSIDARRRDDVLNAVPMDLIEVSPVVALRSVYYARFEQCAVSRVQEWGSCPQKTPSMRHADAAGA